MIYPRVDKLLNQVPDRYGLVLVAANRLADMAAVMVAAKRARQLNSYYRALGEGSYEDYTPPMVESQTGNYLTIALEEVAEGKIKHEYKK